MLKQETDGPQSGVSPLWKKPYNSRMMEEARPCPDKIKDHIFLILELKETSGYMCAERHLGGQKGRGRQLIVGDVSLPSNLFTGLHLG